jgi:magnesium-transporting ATPase (P-type)
LRIDYYNKSIESRKYKVLRGFMNYEIINEEELLVGDIVSLTTGEHVSFDCLMVKGEYLKVDENVYRGDTSAFLKRKYQVCLAAYQ